MRERRRVDELMDDPKLPAADHDRALAGLERLNRWSRSHWLLWPRIRQTAREATAAGRTLRVVDVATGSGDAPVAMAQKAVREGLRIEWMLCDLSPHALETAARRAHAAAVPITTVACDLWREPIPVTGHLVINSLFIHHCEPAQAEQALGRMRQAAELGVAVTDLDRSRLGLTLAWVGSRVLSRSPVVHFDAIASVRAAFSVAEIRAIADRAGLGGAEIDRAWPERWRLWWRCPERTGTP